LHLCWL